MNENEVVRLRAIVTQYTDLKKIAYIFDKAKVQWGIAAGSAYFIYSGDESGNDGDIDIWVDQEDKEKVAKLLKIDWTAKSSERHRAENIEMGNFDIFTNCLKINNGKQVLDYRWTDEVTKHLRKETIGGGKYNIISPEDVALLKIANPRSETEKMQADRLLASADEDYLKLRKKECGYINADSFL